jgi:hypothetical protein
MASHFFTVVPHYLLGTRSQETLTLILPSRLTRVPDNLFDLLMISARRRPVRFDDSHRRNDEPLVATSPVPQQHLDGDATVAANALLMEEVFDVATRLKRTADDTGVLRLHPLLTSDVLRNPRNTLLVLASASNTFPPTAPTSLLPTARDCGSI